MDDVQQSQNQIEKLDKERKALEAEILSLQVCVHVCELNICKRKQWSYAYVFHCRERNKIRNTRVRRKLRKYKRRDEPWIQKCSPFGRTWRCVSRYQSDTIRIF